MHVIDINGVPGLVSLSEGRPASALTMDVDDGQITHLYLMAAPSKLSRLRHPA